jgi:hypothetical protein
MKQDWSIYKVISDSQVYIVECTVHTALPPLGIQKKTNKINGIDWIKIKFKCRRSVIVVWKKFSDSATFYYAGFSVHPVR